MYAIVNNLTNEIYGMQVFYKLDQAERYVEENNLSGDIWCVIELDIVF